MLFKNELITITNTSIKKRRRKIGVHALHVQKPEHPTSITLEWPVIPGNQVTWHGYIKGLDQPASTEHCTGQGSQRVASRSPELLGSTPSPKTEK